MSRIAQIVQDIVLATSQDGGTRSDLVSVFSTEGADGDELLNLRNVDEGLMEFWRMHESAELFKDKVYGQWGLRILTPSASRKITQDELIERPREMLSTDLVFAEFLGDSEQLLMDLAFNNPTRKPIYVKLPLDRRYDWPKIADSFEEFLEKYHTANGEKFWEFGTA
jgi:hypothetical protein